MDALPGSDATAAGPALCRVARFFTHARAFLLEPTREADTWRARDPVREALEVFTAAGLGDAESDPLDASIAIAKAYDVAVVVTLGSEGAAACLPHRPPGFAARSDGGCDVLTAAAAPLAEDEQILDTVGAGDAFVGAFCAALAENAPLSACMARASAAGTIACTAVGAQAGVPDAEKMLARAEAVEATGNWGPGDPPSESLLNAEGLSWGRVKV